MCNCMFEWVYILNLRIRMQNKILSLHKTRINHIFYDYQLFASILKCSPQRQRHELFSIKKSYE